MLFERISRISVVEWSALAGILAVVGGGAAFVTSTLYSAKLARYETAKDLQLDKSLAELRKLSAALTPALEERKAMQALPAAQAKVATLEKELAAAITQRDAAENALVATRRLGELVTIRINHSEQFIDNTLRVGVAGVSTLSSSCNLSYGSNDYALVKVGGKAGGFDAGSNSNFEIKLVSVAEDSCTIEFRAWTAAPKDDAG
jgi:hypothetical protein